jgi:hypothetical protein
VYNRQPVLALPADYKKRIQQLMLNLELRAINKLRDMAFFSAKEGTEGLVTCQLPCAAIASGAPS